MWFNFPMLKSTEFAFRFKPRQSLGGKIVNLIRRHTKKLEQVLIWAVCLRRLKFEILNSNWTARFRRLSLSHRGHLSAAPFAITGLQFDWLLITLSDCAHRLFLSRSDFDCASASRLFSRRKTIKNTFERIFFSFFFLANRHRQIFRLKTNCLKPGQWNCSLVHLDKRHFWRNKTTH